MKVDATDVFPGPTPRSFDDVYSAPEVLRRVLTAYVGVTDGLGEGFIAISENHFGLDGVVVTKPP